MYPFKSPENSHHLEITFVFKASIAAGRVTVDGQAVKSEHVLRDGQLIVFWPRCFVLGESGRCKGKRSVGKNLW